MGLSVAAWAISRLESILLDHLIADATDYDQPALIADSIAPDAVAQHLTGRFGRPYLYVESCPSTQDLLAADAPEGAVAATDLQRSGRGRHGRTWEAPAGSALLCSIALRPPAAARAPELTLVGAVAVARTVEEATGLKAEIKWPNDVLLESRKVAGVLGELRDGLVVLGVGINVNQAVVELPAAARIPATSLRVAAGHLHDRAVLLASLLLHLERAYDGWCLGGLGAVRAEIATRDFLRSRSVEVDGIRGVAAGIDDEGRLELDVGGSRVVVETGEVTV